MTGVQTCALPIYVGAILEVRPQVFVKGIDYTGSELLAAAMLACAEVGAELRITETEKMSSRAIVKKAQAANNVVACASCKRPVEVTALNAVRCVECEGRW